MGPSASVANCGFADPFLFVICGLAACGLTYSTTLILYSSSYQSWAKLVLIALERYSVELKRLTFNLR